MRVKEESEKASFRLLKKLRLWHLAPLCTANRRGKVEVVIDFFFLDTKITADYDCSHEIRQLFLGRKAMTNLDSMLKQRHYSANKGPYGEGCGLPSGHIQL